MCAELNKINISDGGVEFTNITSAGLVFEVWKKTRGPNSNLKKPTKFLSQKLSILRITGHKSVSFHFYITK